MAKSITLTIDGREVTVPEGTLIVDAAKKIGIDIPVFCYHPKLAPVGMCRMCLVDVGRPAVDRATGEFVKDETGQPRITFGPKLDTACTTPVSQGMVVHAFDDKVSEARRAILEFLLTSHPLDCPICDKGGECPLQNLTLRHGPGVSRFLYSEKQRLAKRLPLGELIYLDRERCIQCARCIRFQDEVVDDPVLEFSQRGRELQIITLSDPGFDSYFSGNTTDICPVGALTTADFRFTARVWEVNNAASICPHCPVGCNLTLNVRREAAAGGRPVVKRIMPRQNEAVNEIWICDKGRWGYHYTQSDDLLTTPLLRRNGELVPVPWEEALSAVTQSLQALPPESGGRGLVTLAGGRLSNEDLFHLRQLADHLKGSALLNTSLGGGDMTARFGLQAGSNFKDMGKGTVILVAACDLEEEAPIWWLRVKQAAQRGAVVISLNPRPTKLDRAARYSLRYAYGSEVQALERLFPSAGAAEPFAAAAGEFAAAANAVIIYGQEGASLESSQALAETAARLLVETGHVGRPNNGLVAVWPEGNTQGAWETGFRPAKDLAGAMAAAGVLYLAAADPVGEDARLAAAVQSAGFVIVQDIALSETARLADVVLPAAPFTAREGTFTSGERRVQRFYPAAIVNSSQLSDFTITARIARGLGLNLEEASAQAAFQQLAWAVPAFSGLSYPLLAEVEEQDPIIGRKDMYYGGTSYGNSQGLGKHLQPADSPAGPPAPAAGLAQRGPFPPEAVELLAVPVTRLYDRGQTLMPSRLLEKRMASAQVTLAPAAASSRGLTPGKPARLALNGQTFTAVVLTDEAVPEGVALVPRSVGIPLSAPAAITLQPLPQPAQETLS